MRLASLVWHFDVSGTPPRRTARASAASTQASYCPTALSFAAWHVCAGSALADAGPGLEAKASVSTASRTNSRSMVTPPPARSLRRPRAEEGRNRSVSAAPATWLAGPPTSAAQQVDVRLREDVRLPQAERGGQLVVLLPRLGVALLLDHGLELDEEAEPVDLVEVDARPP